jgi:hypothetical protein
MNPRGFRIAGLLAAQLLLGGCAIGYDRVLFFTTSNIGIDTDTRPPTAEISIARREAVIEPTFEGGQTPPVLASFASSMNVFLRFFFGIDATFAGGSAAKALDVTESVTGTARETALDGNLCLSAEPRGKILWGLKEVRLPTAGEMRPFVFATDTTLGLKVAWSGTTAQYPDSVKLGFQRKEFALAPLMARKDGCFLDAAKTQKGWAVGTPAFLAVLDQDTRAEGAVSIEYLQYFATGDAAVARALDPNVQKVMKRRLDPVAAAQTYDPGSKCVQDWLAADPARAKELTDWWTAQKLPGSPALAPMWIASKENAEARGRFVEEKKIQCAVTGG